MKLIASSYMVVSIPLQENDINCKQLYGCKYSFAEK